MLSITVESETLVLLDPVKSAEPPINEPVAATSFSKTMPDVWRVAFFGFSSANVSLSSLISGLIIADKSPENKVVRAFFLDDTLKRSSHAPCSV